MMRNAGKLALLGIFGLALGCSDQDVQRLAQVGRLSVRKLQTGMAGSPEQFRARLSAISGDSQKRIGATPLDRRVAARLRWDRLLADCSVEVQGAGSQVELTGTVAKDEQRRRAVELAEATAGVEAVVDKIRVVEP